MSFDPEILNELYSLMSKERYVLLEYNPLSVSQNLKNHLTSPTCFWTEL
ncbi:MAG: hypothetical protein CM15mP65_18920 [Crocinitomicaceae bacterium]|nr:MAG: hypothetical protein CM15mP65_18920 [Crocinitomicaceae bacterium]